MSNSIPIPSDLHVHKITFDDQSVLISGSQFLKDSRFRKRLRVDGTSQFNDDVTVDGNMYLSGSVLSGNPPVDSKFYTDAQTGWGLEQWTFSGATYNKSTDSLIVKIYEIQVNYATLTYVDSKIQNTSSKYLVAKEPNTVPSLANPAQNYVYPATTLAANSIFYIRDTTNGFNVFRFQKSPVIGHVLKCTDAEGTVGWQPEQSTATSAQTITTNTSSSDTQFSFKVVDSASSEGFLVFPKVNSNLYNKALTSHSTALLLGTGDFPTYQYKGGIGCYSFGSEYIEFESSTSTNSPNGKVRITGGSSTTDQNITLGATGIQFHPRANTAIQFFLPKILKTSSQWTKPVSILGVAQDNDEYPTLVVTKQDTANAKTSIMFNPRCGAQKWSPIIEEKNPIIIFGDSSTFEQTGETTTVPTSTQTLVIAPWSAYSDGLQIRNSIAAEENDPNANFSGFTRITGASTSNLITGSTVRVPGHYVEVNRKGIFLKNRSNTKTINYGPFEIINQSSGIFNNSLTDTVPASFSVGSVNSLVNSTFYGDLFFKNNPVANYVWTCTDTSGKGEWKVVNATYPTSVTVNTITATNLSATTAITTNLTTSSMTLPDLIATRSHLTAFIAYKTPSYIDMNIYNPDNSLFNATENSSEILVRQRLYRLIPIAFAHVCDITVSVNDYNFYEIYLPIWINHKWNFLNNRQETDERENMWYELVEIEYKVTDQQGVIRFQGTTGITSEETVAVGFDRRGNGTNANVNTCEINQQVFIKSIHLFIPTVGASGVTEQFWIRPKFNFYYTGEFITNFVEYNGNLYRWRPFVWQANITEDPSVNYANNHPHDGLNVQYKENGVDLTHLHLLNWDEIKWDSFINYKTGDSGDAGYWGTPIYFYNPIEVKKRRDTLNIRNLNNSTNNISYMITDLSVNKLLVNTDLQILNGYLTTQGIRCRPGYGNVANEDINTRDRTKSGSYAWRMLRPHFYNIDFNIRKNQSNLIEIWIDNSIGWDTTTNASDYRIKENFRAVPKLLDRFAFSLPVYSYDIIEHGAQQKTSDHVGIIAHELQETFPELPHLVNREKDADELQTVNHHEMIMLLTAAVKEMAIEIKSLQSEIYSLKSLLS